VPLPVKVMAREDVTPLVVASAPPPNVTPPLPAPRFPSAETVTVPTLIVVPPL